jgi:PAS domain S-box-containing protein
VLLVVAMAGFNLLLPGTEAFLGLLCLGPLLAAGRLSVLLTGLVSGYAMLAGLAFVLLSDRQADLSRWGILISGTLMALWLARIRDSRERAVLRLHAEQDVTRGLYEADDVPSAAQRVLGALGRRLGWETGQLWQLSRRGDVLMPIAQWSADGAHVDITSLTPVQPGQGLIGTAWQQGQALRSETLSGTPGDCAADARPGDMTAALAFPLPASGKTAGVIVFYGSQMPREEAGPALEGFARQIGQFLERQRAQSASRDVEIRRAAVVEASLDAVVGMNQVGEITEWNRAAETMFGLSREQAVGRPLAETIIPASSRTAHEEGVARLQRTKQPRILGQRVEVEAMRADGSLFPAELTATQVPLPGPPNYTASIRDITQRREAEQELREREARFRALFDNAIDPVVVFDDAGRYLSANPSALTLFGLTLEQMRERHISEFSGGHITHDWEQFVAEGRFTGLSFLTMPDGRRVIVEVSSAANFVPGEHLAIMRDVTQRVQKESEERFLADAAAVLADSGTDYTETLGRVARLAVPEIADWCAVDLVGPGGRLKRVALMHADPAKIRMAEQMAARYPERPEEDGGMYAVLRSREPMLWPLLTDEMLRTGARDEEHLRLLREVGLVSAMIVPMIARGRTLGVITLVSSSESRVYGEHELGFASQLAAHCSLAVDNARLYEERSHQATTLQESLLPAELPVIEGLELAARYEAAGEVNEIGGDFYDCFPLNDGRWAFALGDVCGKGAEAAAVTALARYTLRAIAPHQTSPAAALTQLNESLRRQRDDGRFCTIALGFLSADHRTLTLALGGHPQPLLRSADGCVVAVGTPGTTVGVTDDPVFADREVQLAAGDTVALFSDGLADRRIDGRMRSEEAQVQRVLAGCANARQAAQQLVQDALDAQAGSTADDVAVLAFSVLSLG